MRPSKVRVVARTSDSIGSVPPAGVNGRSIGRSINEKAAGVCSLPSSRISKSSLVRFRTNAPVSSVTMAWTSTKLVSALNVTEGWGPVPGCCEAPRASQSGARASGSRYGA